MIPGLNPGKCRATIEALRFTLTVLDDLELAEAGLIPEPREPHALALAELVIGARRAIAELDPATDPAGRNQLVRTLLQAELESHEIGLTFAEAEAEMADGDQQA